MSKWSDANGNKGQKWGREKIARKWNDANGYKGHKWPREKTVTEGNDANHYSEQYYGKEKKTMNKWNDANGSTEECNITARKWDDANGYKEQSNKKALSEKGQTGSSLVDYESLFPLTRIPQVCLLMHSCLVLVLTFQKSIEIILREKEKQIISIEP